MIGGVPFKMSLVLGEGENQRRYEIEGFTPQLDNGNLLDEKLGLAHGADCLLGCSKSLAEAGRWVHWQARAREVNMRQIPKERM